MLRSYLTAALRHARRHPGATAINVVGLTLGLTVCLLVGLYLRHELSYDRFHPDADRLVRVVTADGAVPADASPEAGLCCTRGTEGLGSTPSGLARLLTDRLAGIEAATVLDWPSRRLLSVGERRFYADGVMRTDPHVFDVFGGFDLLRGDPSTALDAPGRAVLTPDLAARLFGDADPMGRTFTLENETTYTVTGLVAAPPPTSHVQFRMLRSLTEAERATRFGDAVNWNHIGHGFLYLRLAEGVDAAALARQMHAVERAAREEAEARLLLQPVPAIHLYPSLRNDPADPTDVRYLYFFGAVGLVVLLLALVNYVNLATARAAERGREVGVRKAAGASRGQLVGQFVGEAVLTALVALPLALVAARLALPVANDVGGLALAFDAVQAPGVLAALALGVAGVGLLAGAYPAFVLARKAPATVLAASGRTTTGGGARRLRQGLVVAQLAATVALVAATGAIRQQLDFVRTQRLGFDQARVVTFRTGPMGDDYAVFKARLDGHPAVEAVTSGPAPGISHVNMRASIGKEPDRRLVSVLAVDYDYVETMQLEVTAGRAFDAARADEGSVLVSEDAVQAFGLEGDPVGQSIAFMDETYRVTGVVQNFHNASLRQAVEPMVLMLRPGHNWSGAARLAAGRVPEGLEALEAAWDQVRPDRPFAFTFLDARIEAQYRAEQRLATLFGVFAALALGIAGLGLVGMVAFAVRRRTKEIGIRKALGATATQIVRLLAGNLVRLVALAVALGTPLAYLGLARWLDAFAYRIDLGPGLFLAAGGLTLALALAVAAAHTLRAARTDPASVLRTE